jgi:hypothetical protein
MLIHDSDELIYSIKIFLIVIGILALLLTVVYPPNYDYQNNIKNIIIIPQIWDKYSIKNNNVI